MIDPRFLRDNPEAVERAVRLKRESADVERILALDQRRRELVAGADERKARRKTESRRIAGIRKAGGDAAEAMEAVRQLGEEIRRLDAERAALEAELEQELLRLPNLPADDVPEGEGAADNREERRHGEARRFDFAPRNHQELGEALGILDLKAAARTSGSGFFFLLGAGARLERALIDFMIDLHVREHGYLEVQSPFLVRPDSCTGTGQLPKLADDMYRIDRDDLYLIPTAEVSLTNLYRERLLAAADLPVKLVGQSHCFRREAGSHGKETTGLQRVHQFQKVELVQLVRPEASAAALESLTRDAEAVLQRLELHYRVVTLCAGDLGFASAKTYDLEVWAPGLGRYLEVSSCSNFLDFQARRAGIRFRGEDRAVRFVHTLNGSGLALPRLMIALLETFQCADGTIDVPRALRPCLGGMERIG
ncbi:MAG: serine--tRNA ligase [Planctomycetes bacterium]|nr:serine--tRNA ligase [Planctomycetota bacterium]